MNFRSGEFKCFHFREARFDETEARLSLHYSLDDSLTFVEHLQFPKLPARLTDQQKAALPAVLKFVLLTFGISYFKTALPPKLKLHQGNLTTAEIEFYTQLYRQGLAELLYRNNLDLNLPLEFSANSSEFQELQEVKLARRALLPIGGGKDSLVSLALLEGMQKEFTPFSLATPQILRPLFARLPVALHVQRQIDPRLFAANNEGAYNGHVPISAIIAATLTLTGLLYNYDEAVLSNESSANEATLIINGQSVNHQFSKSLTFESAVSEQIKKHVLCDFNYFSLLRPFSELAIARRFAEDQRFDDCFTSCNQAFRAAADGKTLWCCNCPKCVFVFLALAPFMSYERCLRIFGRNLLDDTKNLQILQELCGLTESKPFECVGTVAECRAALLTLKKLPEWSQSHLLRDESFNFAQESSDLNSILEQSSENHLSAVYQEFVSANF